MPHARSLRYSPLRHLAYSIWLNHEPEHRYMAMFTAYFDASGDPNSGNGAMFVSGHVSSMDLWLEFEDIWPGLLKQHGVQRPFHMTDFATHNPPYGEWAGDLDRQKVFLTEVRKAIKAYAALTVSQGVVIADFKRLHVEYLMPETWSSPLAYCAFGAWHQIELWREQNLGPDDRLRYVYESGDADWPEFVELARNVYGFTPIPEDKGDASPLELADHVAWEHRHMLEQMDQKTGRNPRGSNVALYQEVPGANVWAYGGYESIRDYFDKIGMPKRERPMTRAEIRAWVATRPDLPELVRFLLAPPYVEKRH